jgi:excisionase family DNA binding protein
MTNLLTAEDVFIQVKQMPKKERIRFFSLIANNVFEDSNFSHEQVLPSKKFFFSAEEAAEYLEISMPTLRRYVQANKLKPSKYIGRSHLFSTSDLRRLKQKLS